MNDVCIFYSVLSNHPFKINVSEDELIMKTSHANKLIRVLYSEYITGYFGINFCKKVCINHTQQHFKQMLLLCNL